VIGNCNNSTETEIIAVEEGLSLALHWTQLKFTAKSDCLEAMKMVKESTPNTSVYAFRISALRDLIMEKDGTIVKVSREAKTVSHELSRLGR
jgi:hypothetical protein